MSSKPHQRAHASTPVITTATATPRLRVKRGRFVSRANDSATRPIENATTTPTPASTAASTTWPRSVQSTRGVAVTIQRNVVVAYAATTVGASTGATGSPHRSFTFAALIT